MKRMSKFFTALVLVSVLFGLPILSGCADRPERSPETYGTVVNVLPYLPEAKAPFKFPYAGETDHGQCEFNEDDFL